MKKTPIIIAVAALGAAYYAIQILGSETALMDRHPDIDPDIVVKIHREMVKETLLGKHTWAETDDDYDKIFRLKLTDHQ